MNSIGRFFRVALTVIFIFSLIPVAVLQQASPVEATPGWMKYPGNLSLNDKYVLDSCVIKDGSTYKMWYTRLSFDMSVSQLFTDMKGLNLGSTLTALQNNQFDGFLNSLSGINSTALWTILNGMRTVIGYAESTDGKNWTVMNSNLLGTTGSFTNSVGFPSVIRIDATHYQMWYTSVQSALNSTTLQTIFTDMGSATDSVRKNAFNALLNSVKTVINYATSTTGSSGWTVAGTPALSITGATWDLFNCIGAPAVVMESSSNYTMWYTHLKTNFDSTALDGILTKVRAGTAHISDLVGILGSSALVIGRATSTDGGATFTVQNDKVIPDASIPTPAFWQSAADPCVIKTGSTYEMWYTNGVTNLTSSTLSTVFNQIKGLNIPALWGALTSPSNSLWDFLNILHTTNTTSLQASLNGTSGTIGYATSTDGISWSVQNSSELAGAATTPWSSVGGPSVVKSLTQSEMWFTQGIPALTFQNVLDRIGGVTLSVGYASTKILTSLVITAPANSVASGSTVQFTATGTYNDSSTADLTSAPGIVWSSSNTSKATINASGFATGLAVGATTITATYGTVSSNALPLNVTSAVLMSITVAPATVSVPKGRTQQFTATGNYSDMSHTDITNLVTWTSSNTAVATIIPNSGLATATGSSGTSTVTATFGTVSGTAVFTASAAVYDHLVITPANPSVAKGDTLQLSAIAYNTDGTWSDQTASATWSNDVSGNATVNNTTTKGLVTGVNAGATATITASYTYNSVTKTDTTLVTVNPARLTAFRITNVAPSVAAGLTSASLSLVGDYSDGTTNVTIASNAAGVTWASLNTTIATVAANGAVTGVVPGTATIRATYLGYTATVTFTVNQPNLTAVTVTPANTIVPTGAGNVQYTAIGTYTDGIARALPNTINTAVAWSLTTSTTATIGATTGLLIPGTAGTVTVIATVTGVAPGSTGLTITSAALSSITISAVPTLSVPKGRTRQLIATGNYVGGATADITSMITSWTSGTPTNVSVSGSGLVMASGVATSTSVISATYGSVTGTATVTVAVPDLISIAISPVNPSLALGQTKQFMATGTYSDSTTGDITTSVSWTSGTTTVADIGLHTGLTTFSLGKVTGTAVITASFTRTDTVVISQTTNLTVIPAVLSSIAVTSPGGITVPAGLTRALTATGTYSDTTTGVITSSVVWSSSNSAIASVDATGLLTGHVASTSTVRITAILSGVSNYLDITVNAANVTSVSVDPVGAVIPVGTTRAFRAIANYSDGTKVDVTNSATWSNDVSGHATVNSTTGVVTGATTGAATITATFNAVPGSVSVTVTSAVLSSITVNSATSVAAGKTYSFTATGNYSDNSHADLTNMVTWSSNNTAVATVIPGGLATSYMPGTATISATMPAPYAGSPGTAVLTVTPAVLASISVTPANPQVTFISGAVQTVQFKATGVYSDGSTADLTNTTGIWASTAGGVATILPNTGVATIVGAGSTSITATTGGKTGTSTLTVLADTVAPVVTITSPTAGLITSNKNLTVTGNVDDVNVTTKQLILNGGAPITLTLDGSGNFSAGILLNNGSNTIQVKAIDVAGNIGQSGTVTVKVDAKKPAITITSPADGLLTNNATVTIAGTVTLSATQANVIVNGVSTTVAVTGGAFSTTATLSAGANIICVTAYDPAHTGDTDYLGTSGSRTVTLDITPPVVGVNTPVNNSYVGAAGIVVTGTVDDPAVTSARLSLNGAAPLTIGVVNGLFSQNIALQQGANTIVVQATDAAGNTSPATTRTVTLDTSKPVVTLTAPTNNVRTNAAGQVVSGTVNDPSITTVALYVNGVLDNIPVIGGAFSKMKTLSEGNNTIEVRATNALSNTGSSGVVNVIVDTVSPVLTIGLTDPTSSIGITVTSNEALSAPPTVLVNTTPVTMTVSDINTYTGTYTIPVAADYTVTASGTDTAGNKDTATASFTQETINVNGTVPTPVTSADTTLQVQTNGSVTGAAISVTTTLENPSGNVGNPGGASLGAGAFVEITASPELQNNLNQMYIQVNYDPTQLPSGTDETSLKLYLWDVTSGTWQVVPGSGVNTTAKYIYGTVSHLSTYGGFGSAVSVPVVAPVIPTPPAAGTTNLASSILATGQFTAQVIAFSDDSLCTITIPVNTVGLTSTGVALSQITMVKMTVPPVVPTNNTAVGAVYNFGPNGATFSPAVTIKIPYTDSQIPAGADASKIVIAFQDASGNWTNLTSTVDTVNHVVTATTTHFTSFALLIPTKPATFTTSNLTVSPATTNTGDQVTISVKVNNSGDLSGTYKVTLKINGTVVESKDATVAGGASSTVTFLNSQSKGGTYSVSIDSQSGQFVVTEPVLTTTTTPTTPTTTPAVPAAFTVSNLVVTPATVDINGMVNISVQVTNSGGVSGTYEVKLQINNTDVSSKTVTVASKSSQTVTFTTSQDKAGTYTVGIDGLSGTFTVKSVVTTTPPPPAKNYWPLIIGIIGGIVIIAAVVAIVMVMRKKK